MPFNTQTRPTLPSVDRLIADGQPQFGVFRRVQQVNYLDYHSHLISQRVPSQWRKRMAANQFAFIQLLCPPYRICVAVGTIQWATTAFCYVFDDESHNFRVVEALRPLTYASGFNDSPYQDSIDFSHPKLSVTMQFADDQLGLTIDCAWLQLQTVLARSDEPLVVCSPTARRGWTFTQKEPLTHLRPVSQQSSSHNQDPASTQTAQLSAFTDACVAIDLSQARANLDWTLGYLRRVTNWFWTSINCQLPDGRAFLLNLAMGVNESGVSENACWLDGRIYYLPAVLFTRGNGHVIDSQPDSNSDSKSDSKSDGDNNSNANRSSSRNQPEVWHIRHVGLGWSQVSIELYFTPIRAYQKHDNLGILASIFEQCVGLYSGTIQLADECIVLNEVLGLAEDHYAKW